jgi:hypothetical protein
LFNFSNLISVSFIVEVYIDENREQSEEFAAKHFKDLTTRYCDENGSSSVICVNLVDNKKDQGKLGNRSLTLFFSVGL